MEADWEVELGSSAPVIAARWDGWVDLTAHPEQAERLLEAREFPHLAEALVQLNRPDSPVWTAKCDVWETDPVDPGEMDADPEAAVRFLSSYIDLLPRDGALQALEPLTAWCRKACTVLRSNPLRQGRIDLVIRRASFGPGEGLGVTAYLTGCAESLEGAKAVLAAVTQVFTDAVLVRS